MTEESYYWDGLVTGDATLAPYTIDQFHAKIWYNLFSKDANQGYIDGYLNELAVSGIAGAVSVGSGAALVNGTYYENDAAVNVTIPTPSGSTRIDRIVLRKDWALQTIRITRIAGVEGGGAPSLVQTAGAQWDVPLAQVSITTGGVITVTDGREEARTRLQLSGGGLTLIEEIESDGSTTTFDFQNIPATFEHLVSHATLRTQESTTQRPMAVRFNADSGANYQIQTMEGSGSTDAALVENNATNARFSYAVGASGSANRFGSGVITIANYRRTDLYKTVTVEEVVIPNNTTTAFFTGISGSIWEDTSAINRIQVFNAGSPGSAFDNGSKIALYGLAA